MKKRVIAFLLACLLCFGFSWAQAQTESFVQVLAGKVTEETLTLTLRLGQAGELTCLIYEATEKGEQGALLQVAQWQTQTAGVVTQRVMVPTSNSGYVVQVGGENIDLPKVVLIQESFLSSALRMEGEETTQTLAEKATYLTNVEFFRNEKTVTPGDVVLPGDTVTATFGEAPYTGYAVVAGDADLDGSVNAKDALLVLRHAVGKITLSNAALAGANFKQNGKIDAVVALNILKFAVGKLNSL